MTIEKELILETYQNFEDYQKINIIDIQITDPEVMRKLSFFFQTKKSNIASFRIAFILVRQYSKTLTQSLLL